MNTDTTQSREQKLEAALLQFVVMIAELRRRQKKFDEHYGYQNKIAKHRQQAQVDKSLATMGITDETDLKELKSILFISYG